MSLEIFLAGFSGLGLGAVINSFVNQYFKVKTEREARWYEEKKRVYEGLLTSMHDAVIDPSLGTAMAYALWQAKCDLFGSEGVRKAAQHVKDTNPKSSDRSVALSSLIELMRQDLGETR